MSHTSKKYSNLYKDPKSPYWSFRKYSSEKRQEFKRSTGLEDEAKAYKKGLEMFNEWLGSEIDHSRVVLIKDIARAILSSKEVVKRDRTYTTSKNQIEKHILPYFGHLKPCQITSLRWDEYDAHERKKGKRTKLFNTRKALIEILNRAKDENLIKKVPELKLHDQKSRQGKYIEEITVKTLICAASPDTSLLIEILYLMGARPGEVIQYEYSMIHWDEGVHGTISIPGRITKTGRSRKIPLNSRVSALLWFRMHEKGGKYVFPSPSDPNRPIREYKTGWNSACRKVGITRKDNILLYDLRDTWVTNQAKRNIPIGFTAKYADTSPEMIHKIYLRTVDDSMQNVAG